MINFFKFIALLIILNTGVAVASDDDYKEYSGNYKNLSDLEEFYLINIRSLDLFKKTKNDNITLIHFHEPWCSPCEKSVEIINKIYNDADNVSVMYITLRSSRVEKIKKAYSELFVDQSNVFISPGAAIHRSMGIIGIPHTYIADKDGVIKYKIGVFLNKKEESLTKLLQNEFGVKFNSKKMFSIFDDDIYPEISISNLNDPLINLEIDKETPAIYLFSKEKLLKRDHIDQLKKIKGYFGEKVDVYLVIIGNKAESNISNENIDSNDFINHQLKIGTITVDEAISLDVRSSPTYLFIADNKLVAKGNLVDVDFLSSDAKSIYANALGISNFDEVLEKSKKSSTFDPIHVAAAEGYTEALRFIIETGENPSKWSSELKTPAFYAATNNHVDAIQVLAEAGVDLTSMHNGRGQMSILQYAVDSDALEVVEYLLRQGIDPSEKNSKSHDAVYYAIKNDNIKILSIISEKINMIDNQDRGYIASAAKVGSTEALNFLINVGLNPSLVNELTGMNPAHHAAFGGKIETLKILVKSGVDITLRDKGGETALQKARQSGSDDIVEYIKSLTKN